MQEVRGRRHCDVATRMEWHCGRGGDFKEALDDDLFVDDAADRVADSVQYTTCYTAFVSEFLSLTVMKSI